MTIKFSTTAPGWSTLRGEREHAALVFAAVEEAGLADIPGVKLVYDPDAKWCAVDLHRNVLATDTWYAVEEKLGREYGDPYEGRLQVADLTPTGRPLYPHQIEAVQRLVGGAGGFLCDSPGLGKTVSAGVSASQLANGDGPVLILAPKFTRAVWRRELLALGLLAVEDDWFQIEHVDATPDDFRALRRARWWFCHYDIAYAWAGRWVGGALPRPRVAVIDEAHWLKQPQSRRAKAAHACVGTIPNRILLTGTPVANRPRELWSLLTLLDGPYSWGSHGAFRVRYCGASNDGYGLHDQEPTNVEELKQRMAGRYLRRTIADAGIWMPPLSRAPLHVECADPGAHRVASADLPALLAALERGSFGDDTLRMMQKLMQGTSAAKVPATAEFVNGLVDQEESAVVFCHERKTCERLSKLVEGSIFIHGGYSQEERDELVAKFQDGHGTALFATYGALREGVTLHRARHVVLHDLSWVPSDILQGEARAYRLGQKRAVTSTWCLLSDSFDTLLAAHLVRKASAILASIDDASAEDAFAAIGFAKDGVENEARALLAAWSTT